MTRAAGKGVLALVAVVFLAVSVGDDEPPQAEHTSGGRPDPAASAAPAPSDPVLDASAAPVAPEEPRSDVLRAAGDGDGDSWHDTGGREYRLGLVNTPETDECFGFEATSKRRELTSGGFRADVYTTDAYSRSVAVVTLADGTNLNVWLARHGYADDTYLERFRSENPALAAELDQAFAAAKAEGAGLWGACFSSAANAVPPPAAPAPDQHQRATGECHPDYLTCIPIKGDGSGRGAANDLDCGQIGAIVQLRQVAVDPYRLDRERDGFGCEPA